MKFTKVINLSTKISVEKEDEIDKWGDVARPPYVISLDTYVDGFIENGAIARVSEEDLDRLIKFLVFVKDNLDALD